VTYEAFAEHLRLARPLPTWLPWPLPPGWLVTDFGCVAAKEGPARATFASCSGPSDRDGTVELTVVTEEPGVGVGARIGAVVHSDPGRETCDGAAPARLRLDLTSVPVWPVSTSEEDGDTLDRAVLVGEVFGRWLWAVLRPASAALLVRELPSLQDLSELGPELLTMPFGEVPPAW
jgi:hypothetical protein